MTMFSPPRCFLLIFVVLLSIARNSSNIIQEDPTVFLLNADHLNTDSLWKEESKLSGRPKIDEYLRQRKAFLTVEQSRSLGEDLTLNSREQLANKIIMVEKDRELSEGYQNPSNFIPAKHIFYVLQEIKSSTLYNLLEKMPKGGVLHAHDTAVASTDYVLSLTYRDNLWMCLNRSSRKLKFLFSKNQPDSIEGCVWTLVAEERSKRGQKLLDKELRKYLTLFCRDPDVEYPDQTVAWDHFSKIFGVITPLLTYYPVWKDYFNETLTQFYADGVQYLELRGTLPKLYDLEGNTYTEADTVQAYIDVLTDFRAKNPGFVDVKFIYAPSRGASDETFQRYLKTLLELKNLFPNFIVGFDLVNHEDKGRPLIDFAEALLTLPDSVNFYFHAGETNWYGTTDENLIDAILLGTKRIGHGYGITKHPQVLEFIKKHGIAVEVNPISNQVLSLLHDIRNHPATFLFAENYPVVISSDDPSFWATGPLTYDFYVAFLGIASAQSDLRTLKQLAINSFAYSSLSNDEKKIAFEKWQFAWDIYIEWVIKSYA